MSRRNKPPKDPNAETSDSRKRNLARSLREHDGWKEIVVPYLKKRIREQNIPLLNKPLTLEEAAGHRAARQELLLFRKLLDGLSPPQGNATDIEDSEDEEEDDDG